MTDKIQFPIELLDASKNDRVKYFIKKRIKHKHLADTYQKLIKTLNKCHPSQIIIVYGATGTGKTTLCDKLETDILNQHDLDPGSIPIARIEVVPPSSGFSWKEYYRSALESLDEPLIDYKLDPQGIIDIRRKSKPLSLNIKATEVDLRKAMEKAFLYRSTGTFVVDEAQHLKKVLSGKKLLDQMDTLKSIVNITGVKHVLAGPYELIGLTDLSGQLNRRTTEIHLSRYHYDLGDELKEFIDILVNLVISMPVEIRPKLTKYIDEIYEGTAGCVGILKDWLTRSLILALDQNDKTISIEHLLETKIPDRQMLRISREINEGEKLIYVNNNLEIRSMLGMSSDESDKDNSKSKNKNKVTRPGERLPKRDPIGRETTNV